MQYKKIPESSKGGGLIIRGGGRRGSKLGRERNKWEEVEKVMKKVEI